jgi:hypothetical protein
MPCPVAGGGTVVRMNGLVVGCALRQPANALATRMTAQGRFIGQTPFAPASRALKRALLAMTRHAVRSTSEAENFRSDLTFWNDEMGFPKDGVDTSWGAKG